MLSCVQASPPTENKKIGKRVTSQAICTVQTAGNLPRRKESLQSRLSSFRIYSYAAHVIVHSRSYFHLLFCDIYSRKFEELCVHAWKSFLDVLSSSMSYVKIYSTVWSASSLHYFSVNRSCHYIPCGKLLSLWIVLLHESLSFHICEYPSFSSYCFGNEHSANSSWKYHTCWMELNHFHVHELGPCPVS